MFNTVKFAFIGILFASALSDFQNSGVSTDLFYQLLNENDNSKENIRPDTEIYPLQRMENQHKDIDHLYNNIPEEDDLKVIPIEQFSDLFSNDMVDQSPINYNYPLYETEGYPVSNRYSTDSDQYENYFPNYLQENSDSIGKMKNQDDYEELFSIIDSLADSGFPDNYIASDSNINNKLDSEISNFDTDIIHPFPNDFTENALHVSDILYSNQNSLDELKNEVRILNRLNILLVIYNILNNNTVDEPSDVRENDLSDSGFVDEYLNYDFGDEIASFGTNRPQYEIEGFPETDIYSADSDIYDYNIESSPLNFYLNSIDGLVPSGSVVDGEYDGEEYQDDYESLLNLIEPDSSSIFPVHYADMYKNEPLSSIYNFDQEITNPNDNDLRPYERNHDESDLFVNGDPLLENVWDISDNINSNEDYQTEKQFNLVNPFNYMSGDYNTIWNPNVLNEEDSNDYQMGDEYDLDNDDNYLNYDFGDEIVQFDFNDPKNEIEDFQMTNSYSTYPDKQEYNFIPSNIQEKEFGENSRIQDKDIYLPYLNLIDDHVSSGSSENYISKKIQDETPNNVIVNFDGGIIDRSSQEFSQSENGFDNIKIASKNLMLENTRDIAETENANAIIPQNNEVGSTTINFDGRIIKDSDKDMKKNVNDFDEIENLLFKSMEGILEINRNSDDSNEIIREVDIADGSPAILLQDTSSYLDGTKSDSVQNDKNVIILEYSNAELLESEPMEKAFILRLIGPFLILLGLLILLFAIYFATLNKKYNCRKGKKKEYLPGEYTHLINEV